MYLRDKSKDNWSQFTDPTMTTIRYDDGTTKPFTLSDVEMTFGKYAGKLLTEIDDRSYLEWLAKSDNEFMSMMAQRRLLELI